MGDTESRAVEKVFHVRKEGEEVWEGLSLLKLSDTSEREDEPHVIGCSNWKLKIVFKLRDDRKR